MWQEHILFFKINLMRIDIARCNTRGSMQGNKLIREITLISESVYGVALNLQSGKIR